MKTVKIKRFSDIDGKVYYCELCGIEHKLPCRRGDNVAGYCFFCGIASVYIGFITTEEAKKLHIHIPTVKQLSNIADENK